jgi:triacylglycerol lipase
MTTLVLAHGILGFGNPLGLPVPFNYFNGVAKHFIERGFHVESPQVGALSSIETRGQQIGQFIARMRLAPKERVHVIAHSMGGLDMRHALANVPGVKERVASLVTIGTPHAGSTVADAVQAGAGPIFDAVPLFIRDALTAGLHDLTTVRVAQFNRNTAKVPGPRYIAIAGNAALGAHELLLFRLASIVGQQTGQITDGVVTRASALPDGYEQPIGDWPVDHAGEIGWTVPLRSADLPRLPFAPAPKHFARYDDIVSCLR